MELEHLLSQEKFEKYLNTVKNEAMSHAEEIFGMEIGSVELKPLSEYYQKRIDEYKNMYGEIAELDKRMSELEGERKISWKERSTCGIEMLREYTKKYLRLNSTARYDDDDNTPTIYFPMDWKTRSKFYNSENVLGNKYQYKLDFMHEIGHHMTRIINNLFIWKNWFPYIIDTPIGDPAVIHHDRKFVMGSLSEGFALFTELDCYDEHYNDAEKTRARIRKDYYLLGADLIDVSKSCEELQNAKYFLGYKFMNMITEERGKRESLQAVRLAKRLNPEDILYPGRYLQRFEAFDS